ncbi:MAG: hypothetical protein LBE13_05915 [Bacteroidales bacterium]|jgi:hypothetical protein|nr:hypothetical protein [Bacteroidales bacterium]
MNDKQIAKLNMLKVLIHLLDENIQIYGNVPVFVEIVNELKEKLKEIEKKAQLQSETKRSGSSNEKNEAEITLITLTIIAANTLSVLATLNNNLSLSAKTKVTKSMLYNAHGNTKLDISRILLNEILLYKDELVKYGITPEFIANMEAAVSRYESLITIPRTTIVEGKQVTTNLIHLFADVDTLLNDRLDKLMSIFKLSNPDFYSQYFYSRNVINTFSRKRKQQEDSTENEETQTENEENQ